MDSSLKARQILSQINQPSTKLGDLRKIAKEIKKDHELALELWSHGAFMSRQLAILIMDKKRLTQNVIDTFCADMHEHEAEERLQLIDWLMANQLSKDKMTIAMIEAWENSSFALQRRLFWYYQARLRWMGKTDHANTEELLDSIETNLLKEEADVQWAMNYTAGQIGKWQPQYRARCIAIGENTGLYKDEMVAKNCVPSYLPKFIEIEVAKLNEK